ncbi:nucleotidyl transferase AbiEii/AbiGii toxin family protein [Candidatus Gracilibacteria bacterium]|nr:nucleotidyl transferase AbiEii/AbiGii toxin family protein [Candidatus Gracilibacteria bacterium]
MHINILSPSQKILLPLLKKFRSNFYLVGGTAIALHIGHRKSIDFDLFTKKELRPQTIENQIQRGNFSVEQVFVSTADEYTCLVDGVRLSFVSFPFSIVAEEDMKGIIQMPNLLHLSAMKAYALGRRAKWKDYVDMYFLLRDHFSLEMISHEAERIFGGSFNSRVLREQLIWFEDMDYSETVEFLPRKSVSKEEIQAFLKKVVR